MFHQLSLYIIIQCAVFAALLFLSKKTENKVLAALFAIIALHYTLLYFIEGNEERSANFEHSIFSLLNIIHIPLTVYYFKLILQKPITKVQHSFWLLPVAFAAFVLFYFHSLGIQNPDLHYQIEMYVEGMGFTSVLLIYSVFQLREINQTISGGHSFTPHERIKINVGKWLLYFYIARAVIILVHFPMLYMSVNPAEIVGILAKVILVLFCLYLILFAFVALRKPEIFNDPMAPVFIEQKLVSLASIGEKSLQNKLSEAQQQLLIDLKHITESRQLYTNSDLKQKEVADLLKVPVHYLSKTINDGLGKSFSEFINEYRIIKAKELLKSSAHSNYTIAAIGQESGFQNESLFYRNFKKSTGKTPALFQKE